MSCLTQDKIKRDQNPHWQYLAMQLADLTREDLDIIQILENAGSLEFLQVASSAMIPPSIALISLEKLKAAGIVGSHQKDNRASYYLIEEALDEVINQSSYYFKVGPDKI